MNKVVIRGQVKAKTGPEAINEKLVKSTLVIANNDERWENLYQIEFINRDAELVSNIAVGDAVSCECNLTGRSWNPPNGGETRYFLTLRGVNASRVGQGVGGSGTVTVSARQDDDIPF